MATLGLPGLGNYLPPGSAILTAINNIRATSYGTYQVAPATASQLKLQNASYSAPYNDVYPGNFVKQSGALYRPQIWNQTATWNMIVPVSSQQTYTGTVDEQVTAATGGVSPNLLQIPIVYVFDAILRSDQEEGIRMTEFPVQTGGNISDNAYLLQNRVTLEIGMSDVMDSYYAGQWSNNKSKSIAAYNVLSSLKDARQFVTLTTRVRVYQNMLIERIAMSDTSATTYALRVSVTFRQVFVASVTLTQVGQVGTGTTGNKSSRPQTTDTTAGGSKGTTSVPTAVTTQHKMNLGTPVGNVVPVYNAPVGTPVGLFPSIGTGKTFEYAPDVDGAGFYSSLSTTQVIPGQN